MKSLKDLKNDDRLKVNGEEFRVVRNTSRWFYDDTGCLEYEIELVRVKKHESVDPTHFLVYCIDNPDKKQFFEGKEPVIIQSIELF